MNLKPSQQHSERRQREMLSAAETTLQEDSGSIAGNACLSRYHFGRVFERTVGEPPGGLRRRLILERAAYKLRATETAVAFVTDNQTPEGFSHAFKKAFDLSPQTYRRAAQQIRFWPGSSEVFLIIFRHTVGFFVAADILG